MHKSSYNREIHNMLTQFIAALDGCKINRYEQDNKLEEIDVRYVLAPKQRVIYDIVNQAKNITLPVVAIDIQTISIDRGRNFNKLQNSSMRPLTNTTPEGILEYRQPTPINVTVNVSILARYMTDFEQIIQNWIPYTNNYFMISWKVPTENISSTPYEIRSEVFWDGNISMEQPHDLSAQAKWRITANTTMTIKGWIFPSVPKDGNMIYHVDIDVANVGSRIYNYFDTDGATVEHLDVDGYLRLTGDVTRHNNNITIPILYPTSVYSVAIVDLDGDIVDVPIFRVVGNSIVVTTISYNFNGDTHAPTLNPATHKIQLINPLHSILVDIPV